MKFLIEQLHLLSKQNHGQRYNAAIMKTGTGQFPPLTIAPPGQLPHQLIAPRTIPPDNYPHANYPPDNHPLDSYPLCQLPPGQLLPRKLPPVQ